MDSLFSALANLPQLQSRAALLIINMQNDSFDSRANIDICGPEDTIDRIHRLVPIFRKSAQIVWVRTEIADSSYTQVTADASHHALDGLDAAQLTLNHSAGVFFDIARVSSSGGTPAKRTKQQKEEVKLWKQDVEELSQFFQKTKGPAPLEFWTPGTRGAALCDPLASIVDESKDMMIIKHHYSALDATSLLLSLRMKLVTHLYLCGCVTNVSIYATAADAARHGFEVTVVEDCLAYRSEAQHLEAMRKMADEIGVNGIDSEEIIEEAEEEELSSKDKAHTPNATLGGTERQRLSPSGSDQQLKRRRESDYAIAEPENFRQTDMATVRVRSMQEPRMVKNSSIWPGRENEEGKTPEHASVAPGHSKSRGRRSGNAKHFLGPSDVIGEGDSKIVYEALPQPLAETAYNALMKEVSWQTMRHRSGEVPRRVAVQGEIGTDGCIPIYRHPADDSPPLSQFTPTIDKIRKAVEQRLGQRYNHALIQLYRDGNDNISEHSDKTLDISRGTHIVNVSLGAQRVMILRSKKSASLPHDDPSACRQAQRIPMPHNSLFILGPATNTRWLHGIRADKRPRAEKSRADLAYSGRRISITFRLIATFTDAAGESIWGQGAPTKDAAAAVPVSTEDTSQIEALIAAFGYENQHADFKWEEAYGTGFTVVDLSSSLSQLLLRTSLAETKADEQTRGSSKAKHDEAGD